MSEILGVLFKYLLSAIAIIAIIVILYESVSRKNTSTAATDLTQIQVSIYQLCSGDNNLEAMTTASSLIVSGVLPNDMLSSGSTSKIIDPWGENVQIETAPPSGAVASITFPDVPFSACAKLTILAAQAGTSVTVGSATAYPSDQALVSEAATNCAAIGGGTVPMTFNFYPNNVASSNASSQG